jgi:hypothetical protein
MGNPVWEFDEAEWDQLTEQQKADAWLAVAEAMKRALERFDPHQPRAQERWLSLNTSLKEALGARTEHLAKAWSRHS